MNTDHNLSQNTSLGQSLETEPMTENDYQQAIDELKRYVEEHRDMEITDEKSDCYRETLNMGKDRVIWGQYMREDSAADFSVADVAYSSIYDKELMFFK